MEEMIIPFSFKANMDYTFCMSTDELPHTIAAIETAARGRRTGAFFDVDGAVIAGELEPIASAPRRPGLGDLGAAVQHRLGRGPQAPGDEVAAVVAGARDVEVAELDQRGRKAFARAIADKVHPEVRELVGAHRRRGHTIVLTSSATPSQVRPIAEALGVDEVLCSEPQVKDGRLTGELAGPAFVGEAAAEGVERFASSHGLDLGRSHAYASSDLGAPLLARVGHPHAVNPAKGLSRRVSSEGWPVLHFDSRGRPSPETVVRSVAGYGALLPSMLGGVAVGLLNRDRHEIAQYGVSSYVERLFAITGVTLDVQGEEHLWSHRPAVFIYNHRNNFDPYVAIKLVRRDWGSVAKKEIAGPLTGVMQWLTPNVAFIDRSDSAKAVEGLQPVTELLRSGVSVLVAPEGTRSTSGQLGTFKKGPFRMAMDAGVPIVPIVIRNADRVAGRGAGIIRRGTVDVAVLPPVSVADWTSEDIEDRIAGVRQRFAETIADWPSRSEP